MLWTSLSVIQPKTEISHKVKDILRAYNISDLQSEPYHQNQNPAEWRYRTIKAWTNTIMNRTRAPAHCWLLILQYVCYILNHISTASLDGQVPLLVFYGVSFDISIILLYSLSSTLHMISIFLLIVKKGLVFWVGYLLSIVVILSPTWYLMLKPSKSSIKVLSGPGLLKTPIKGLLLLEGRKIITLTPNPPNIQLQC